MGSMESWGSHDSNKGSFIPRAPIFSDLVCGLESCWLGSRADSTLRKSFEPVIFEIPNKKPLYSKSQINSTGMSVPVYIAIPY